MSGPPVAVRTLRGAAVPAPVEETLSPALEAAIGESAAVVVTGAGKAVALDPLFCSLPHAEPLHLYDGHYGIRVTAKATVESR